MTLLALLSLSDRGAYGASLDLLEVGGAFGTPAATNPSALWWNPAGLAVGGGTQFMIEAAPAFASVFANRTNPDYGALQPQTGYPESYDYSGSSTYHFNGVVPFLGVSSDFMVPGLGVGVGLYVPTARGGTWDESTSEVNRFALRNGNIQAIYATGAVSYQLLHKVAAGLSVSFVDSTYYADIDTTTYGDLAWAVEDFVGAMPSTFQDGYIEDPGYATRAIFGGDSADGGHGVLKDQAVTFGAGIYVTPIGDKLGVSLAYDHGVKLDHTGDLTLKFSCPPDYDGLGLFAAQQAGLCDSDTLAGTTMHGTGEIGYSLPSRLNLGVVVSPIDKVRLEAMGSYVFWSVFQDYDIHTKIDVDQVTAAADDTFAAQTADLVSQDRKWARDNVNTFWAGLDGKVAVNKFFTAGARVIFDKSAIPDPALSANNYDADTVMLTGLAMLTPIHQLGIGASFGHYFLASRTITNSEYGVSIAGSDPSAPGSYINDPQVDRVFYPESNGTYTGSINRVGIVVKGQFMRKGPNW